MKPVKLKAVLVSEKFTLIFLIAKGLFRGNSDRYGI